MDRARRRAALAIGFAAILLVTTSCSSAMHDVRRNGRTLLTYGAGSARADAALDGVLDTNPAGCLAFGKLILVVPDGSELRADGSIVVDGITYRLGSHIHVGGGVGKMPRKNSCGKHLHYWYI